MLWSLPELAISMSEGASLKSALAIQLDVAAHLRLEPWMLGPIIVVAIIFLLIVVLIIHGLWLLVWLELILDGVRCLHLWLIGYTVEVEVLLSMGKRAVLFLAVLVLFIPLAKNRLEVRRDHRFTWRLIFF